MTSRAKALEMRGVIEQIELAICAVDDFEKLERLFVESRDDLRIVVNMTVGELRNLMRAFSECNRIVNSLEYIPANL